MRRTLRALVVLCASACACASANAGCGHKSETSTLPADAAPASCADGYDARADGCYPHFDECGELAVAHAFGGCVVVGVPADGCGTGFVSDAKGGCLPTLPEAACPAGKMAVPGEPTCHEVAPCGTGTWGDIPVEPDTIYVDASYTGGASNGSRDKPFVTVKAAAADAEPRDRLVAIAAGKYVENLDLRYPLRLWGRCPSMVELAGDPALPKNHTVQIAGSSVELHRLAIVGPYIGVGIYDGTGLRLEQLWVHDNVLAGIESILYDTPVEWSLLGSLVEHNKQTGVAILGPKATIERSVVRDTQSKTGKGGYGVLVRARKVGTEEKRADVMVRQSLVERNYTFGIGIEGASATIESTVVRGTLSQPVGGMLGEGIEARDFEGERGDLHLTTSLVEKNQFAGLAVGAASATVDRCVFRGNLPRPFDDGGGVGVTVGDDVDFTFTASLVDGNRTVGLNVGGSRAIVERVLVRDTMPNGDGLFAMGMQVTANNAATFGSEVTMRDSLFLRNQYVGIGVFDSTVHLSGVTVLDTIAQKADGRFGDGIDVGIVQKLPSTVTLDGCVVRRAARAGAGAFGGAMSVKNSQLTCSSFDFDVEYELANPKLDDLGGNLCGCGERLRACKATTAKISGIGRH